MINTRFLEDRKVLAINDTQFGDNGKGKIVKLLAGLWARFVVRCTGGANAGHTTWHHGRKLVLHLVPCGITYPNVTNIIGRGVAVDPAQLIAEITALGELGIPSFNLRLSPDAKLVLPQHIALDRIRDAAKGKDAIGTTGRGIGPCYTDHQAREGLTVNDLINPDELVPHLERNLADKIGLLQTYNRALVRQVMQDPKLDLDRYYDPRTIFSMEAIIQSCREWRPLLEPFMDDTDAILEEAVVQRQNILLEGAQGHFLSVDHGTYPYVTSSDVTVSGMAKGARLQERVIDATLGVTKIYVTRVGGGPLPTEIFGQEAETIRQRGEEYGATTGRPRRIGHLDLVALRSAIEAGIGPNIALMKVDVLDDAPMIRLCTEYRYVGPEYRYGKRVYRGGDRLYTAAPRPALLQHCEPVYVDLPGWQRSTKDIRRATKLPHALLRVVEHIDRLAGTNTVLISNGPRDENTILLKPMKGKE